MQDYAIWQAVYKDGTVVNQKDEGASYESLSRDNLETFNMLTPEGGLILMMPINEGQGGRLIWRRRVQAMPGGGQHLFYVVGKRGGFVAVINPALQVMVDDKFRDDQSIFGDVTPVKGEDAE